MEAGAEPEFDAEAGPADDGEDMAGPEDAERDSDPELVPVAASIFDDDFFNRTQGRNRAAGESEFFGAAVAVQAASAPAPVQEGNPDVRPFAGANGSQAEHPETDELDIPAFLRRSR
jgi:cell division protein FtsZ